MDEKKTLKEWLHDVSEEAKWKLNGVLDWCKENKEIVAVFGPAIIAGSIELMKIATKRSNIREEQRLKENYIYDRSNGHYFETRRQPKRSEWIQIDHRKENGEYLGDILNDMKLLK